MYIYFSTFDAVLTCEEYPQLIPVSIMKRGKLQYMCNKWEKNDTVDGKFTLSYKYKKETCNCVNSANMRIDNDHYHNYDCYECGRIKTKEFEEGADLYLQNSGSMDIVWVHSIQGMNELCKVDGYNNVYKWADNEPNLQFILHITGNRLTDMDITKELKNDPRMQENCFMEFTEFL